MKKSARRDLQREEKCISLKIKPAGILTFYTLLIFGQGLIFFNLNVYWTHFSWWEFLSKMRAFPESSFEVRRKKCKKTVKRDRTTGKCLPFTKRNALQFHARKKKKKRQRAILSYEQSFCLDLNSNWNLLFCRFRTPFLLFYWLHKTVRLCSQSSLPTWLEAGPALVLPWVSREWADCCSGLACRTSWPNWG